MNRAQSTAPTFKQVHGTRSPQAEVLGRKHVGADQLGFAETLLHLIPVFGGAL